MDEIRKRKQDAMERHDTAVQKRNQMEDKVAELERKLRDCRRAIRDTAKAIDAAKKRGRRLPNGRVLQPVNSKISKNSDAKKRTPKCVSN